MKLQTLSLWLQKTQLLPFHLWGRDQGMYIYMVGLNTTGIVNDDKHLFSQKNVLKTWTEQHPVNISFLLHRMSIA